MSRIARLTGSAVSPATALALLAVAPARIPAQVVGQARTKPAPVAFRLVSELDTVAPGTTLTIGLSIEHRPGWHTYWKNPGTVGMATRLKWSLPDGCKAGPIRWQQPQLTKMGVYTVWGYEGRALLLTDIAIPKKLTGDGKLEFRAEVSYMACSTTCRPGHTDVSIVLPRGAKSKPVAPWRERFADVRRQQPRKIEDAWCMAATRDGDTYTLTLRPTTNATAKTPVKTSAKTTTKRTPAVNPRIRGIYFFAEAEPRLVSSNAPQKFHRDGDRLVLRLRREKFTPGDGNRLRGLLHAADGFLEGDAVTALVVDIPIVTVAKKR